MRGFDGNSSVETLQFIFMYTVKCSCSIEGFIVPKISIYRSINLDIVAGFVGPKWVETCSINN